MASRSAPASSGRSRSSETLTPGMRVECRNAEWVITRVAPTDEDSRHFAVHCLGVDDLVRGHRTIFLTQLDTIEPIDPRRTSLVPDTSHGFKQARLFLEAQLRQMPVTDIEPNLEGLGAFEPMPYQEKAVQRALFQMRPRLLLADAVGLGKTIEVGMILAELMRRGRADRILVLAKKSMLTQFQAELWNRFAIPLVRLDSTGIARLRLRIPASKNPFEVYHRIIISIDTLKDVGRYRHFLEQTRWDVVIIDEAHNVAGASVPDVHRSHRLARLLARRTDSLLLTTATPHNGKRETFGRLISLLDPSAIPDPRLQEYSPQDIAPFFLMRFKEDVREEAGNNFPVRVVIDPEQTSAGASQDEEVIYQMLAGLRGEGRWSGESLLQWGFYKLFLSSPEACRHAIEKRLNGLRKQDKASPEIALLERLQEKLTGLSLAQSTRYRLLKKQLEVIGWTGKKDSPRVLLFTEYRQTQEALVRALVRDFGLRWSDKFEDQPNQSLAFIHGSCPDVHLMKTVEAFGTGSSPLRLLVATDVASEGINLHHECNQVIHYDLPWSIITLIQRNGRIDRFGQKNTPFIRYLRVKTTQPRLQGDGAIFQRLVEKVEEINRSTRSGESVMRLYDPEAEERYIAEQGIVPGNSAVLESRISAADAAEANALESVLGNARELSDQLLAELFGACASPTPAKPATSLAGKVSPARSAPSPSLPSSQGQGNSSRMRLFKDRPFLLEGYQYLKQLHGKDYPDLVQTNEQLLLTAPAELKRWLGMDTGQEVVFGATAIPEESWPEDDCFHLTDKVERVNRAIQAARATSGHWSKELLCTEMHPILRWLAERLVMLMPRGQAPYVPSPHLPAGEVCFCFIGQVSSRAGTPLVVDAHAVSYLKGGMFRQRSLPDALEAARFDNLINTGKQHPPNHANLLLPSAVDASLEYLRELRRERERHFWPLLEREEQRLDRWMQERTRIIDERLACLPTTAPEAEKLREERNEMERYLKDRRLHWKEAHFLAAEEPNTRLVLVLEGVA